MIDEARHDIAIEYVLGALHGEALHEFEAWMASDRDLRVLVDELRDTVAVLALAGPPKRPPTHLREKILGAAHEEIPAPAPAPAAPPITLLEKPASATAPKKRTVFLAWTGWAAAASLAVACVFLFGEKERLQTVAIDAEKKVERAADAAQSAQKKATGLSGEMFLAQAQARAHIDQISELRAEVAKLRERDTLSQMKIAALTSQSVTYAKAGAVVMWDPQEQRGVVRVANMPQPDSGKDYQLWVIDAKNPDPVSAGVLTMGADGAGRVTFKPDQAIESAAKFAISVEPAGGVPKVSGPVIFAGE